MPTVGHDNVSLAIEGEESTLLVDCAGSPLVKLQLAGIEPSEIGYLLFTHRHPDHMYGYPILMLDLWLLGQSVPLQVVAEPESLQTAKALLKAFRFEEWLGFRAPIYREMHLNGDTVALDLPDLLVTACRSKHLVPSMAVRITSKLSGRAVVYSSDTAVSASVAGLARGADVLIHEASGDYPGHSTAAQAGQVAEQAGVQSLYLVHYPALDANLNALKAESEKEFSGSVHLARDFGAIEF